jgi:hypothetical protein
METQSEYTLEHGVEMRERKRKGNEGLIPELLKSSDEDTRRTQARISSGTW